MGLATVRELVALAHERRVPVLIHAGRGIPALGEHTVALSGEFPDAKLILAHGAISDLAWLWKVMPEHPNLFIDTAWWNPADLMALFCLAPPAQVLWASDSPYGLPVMSAVGQDQLRVGELPAEGDGVPPERGDPAARVDQHGHAPLVRERDELAHGGDVEAEPLRARVQLDAACAGVQRARGLGHGRVARVDAAVRDDRALRRRGGLDHEVVGPAVALGLVHGEHDAAGARGGERLQQLLRRLREAVGVVGADVRVRVIEREAADLLRERVEVGVQECVDVEHRRRRL